MTIAVAEGWKLVDELLPCIKAAFYEADSAEAYLKVRAQPDDDRGDFFLLDYSDEPARIIEVVHSRPGVLRGNHVHAICTEKLTVTSGEIDLYLGCGCDQKHLLKRRLTAGMSAVMQPTTPHSFVSVTASSLAVAFSDGDPRQDRERVELILST